MIYTTVLYSFTFAVSLLFCRIYEKTRKQNHHIKNILLLMAMVLPVIALATLRYNVGTDYISYIINYINIEWTYGFKGIWKFYSKEPLYVIINLIGYYLFGTRSGIGMFLVASCVFMFFIIEGVSYFKEKISMTFALFIFYTTYFFIFFNAMRQMLAVAVLLFAFRYIFEKKPWKYLLWVIIAGMFHKTAYFLIFLYLLNFKLNSKKVNQLFYTAIALSPILIIPIQKIVVFLANTLKIYDYYTNMLAEFDLKFLLYTLPVLLLVAIKRKQLLKIDSRYEVLIRILFLQIPFQLLGCYIKIADRLAIYCGIFQVILLPVIVRSTCGLTNEVSFFNYPVFKKMPTQIQDILQYIEIKLNNATILKFLVVAWYVVYFIVMYMILKGQGVYPYQWVFNKLEFFMKGLNAIEKG